MRENILWAAIGTLFSAGIFNAYSNYQLRITEQERELEIAETPNTDSPLTKLTK